MKKLIIFGLNSMAELAWFYFKHDSAYTPVAFTIDKAFMTTSTFQGCPVIPFEDIQQAFPPAHCSMFIAVGYKHMNTIRAQKFYAAKQKGYRLASYISPQTVHWPGFTLKENNFILEQTVIQPFVQIAENVIIWANSTISHHTMIHSHTFIAPNVVLAGNVIIGPYCFIGANATVRDRISVPESTLIGAGAVVLENPPPNSILKAPGVEPPSSPLEMNAI